MNVKNTTPFAVERVVFLDRRAAEQLVVAVKATYTLDDDARVLVSPEQAPINLVDVFRGEPGASSILHESEIGPPKPGTDVVLVGSARATRRPVTSLDVTFAVGAISKVVRVLGDRVWDTVFGVTHASSPAPFVQMPLSWENAFGGTDTSSPEPGQHEQEARNPVGKGFRAKKSKAPVAGSALPNIEDPRDLMKSPGQRVAPQGFGFIGRDWEPRKQYAGTYDEAWRQQRMPLLPLDFNDRFHHGAPAGFAFQAPLKGGEPVLVHGCTARERLGFALPRPEIETELQFRDGREAMALKLDTVVVDTDAMQVRMVFKGTCDVHRRLQRLVEIRRTHDGGNVRVAPAAIAITGLGAVTPVGLSAPATCAALRAGVARLKALATHVVDGEIYAKQPVVGGRVPLEWFAGAPVETDWSGHDRFRLPHPPERDELVKPGSDRLIELAWPALREAWHNAGFATVPPTDWRLYLACGEHDDAEAVADAVVKGLGAVPSAIGTTVSGRAGSLVALHAAVADLRAKRCAWAVVGGVDSQIRTATLRRLEAAGVLKSASNPQGINPGEAAAFVVLALTDTAALAGARPAAVVHSLARTAEPTAGTDEPNRGDGLSLAFRETLTAAPWLTERPLVVCDLNGERYRGLEWTLALVRSLGDLRGDAGTWHPADCIGDAGAGLGALDLVWAATALQRGYAGSDHALVWGASDGKDRAAALLGAAEDPERKR